MAFMNPPAIAPHRIHLYRGVVNNAAAYADSEEPTPRMLVFLNGRHYKICFGNQSEDGDILTALQFTATGTCIMQQLNFFNFLTDATQAHRLRLPHPSLVPFAR
jgi:hypothetical protein